MTWLTDLFKPFEVKRMVQTTYKNDTKCICVAYFDARDTMDQLNNLIGINNWQDKITTVSGKTVCSIWIRVDGERLRRSDMGDTKEWKEKTTSSWAFKRAGVKRGIGKFTYDIPNQYLDYKKVWNYGHAVFGWESLKNPIDLSNHCNDNFMQGKVDLPEKIYDVVPVTTELLQSAKDKLDQIAKGNIDKLEVFAISKDQKGIINELMGIIPEFAMTKPTCYWEAEDYIAKFKKQFRGSIISGEHKPDADYIKKVFGDVESKKILSELKKK